MANNKRKRGRPGVVAWARRWSAAYGRATEAEKRAGARWYADARAWVERTAEETGKPRPMVAGVAAALSPRCLWHVNKLRARVALETGVAAGLFADAADRILAGAPPLEALTGPKVRAFYRALMGDDSAAVIDAHMVRAVEDHPRTFEEAPAYRKGASALRAAARRHGVPVAHLQAAVWVRQRGRAL